MFCVDERLAGLFGYCEPLGGPMMLVELSLHGSPLVGPICGAGLKSFVGLSCWVNSRPLLLVAVCEYYVSEAS